MDDRITTWCVANGVRLDAPRPWQGDSLGDVTDDLAGVVVYGGNYNADAADEHPFLRKEYRTIDVAMKADSPCLGYVRGRR